jgi:uncharacterized linocin/CFP29 family protein
MSDFLMRDDAPLSAEDWEKLDKVVVDVARSLLAGRQFIPITGPLGVGVQTVPLLTVDSSEPSMHQVAKREFLPMQLITQDFRLGWHDIEASHQVGVELELGPAAAASAACARAEDEMVFKGLLNAKGHHKLDLTDWEEPGAAFANIVAATETLVDAGFYGPFAVVLSPALYSKTQRVARGMGRLVSKLIKDVAEGGLFRSPMLAENQGLILAQGAHNFDLAVAQDLITAYLGPEGMDHSFRVMESLVLRVKRPGAICVLG